MPSTLKIASAHGTAWLTFRILSENEEGKAFSVAAAFGPFSGSVMSTTYFAGSPAALFVDAAKHWRGWTGAKSWQAIDGELTLTLSMDNLGHCRLSVSMIDGEERLDGSIHLEAGQLESVAHSITDLFGEASSLGRTIR